jgi:hypothetical protein
MDNELRVSQINTQNGLSLDHIVQFAKVWEMLNKQHVEFHDTTNEISWKLSNDGCYLAKSAYKMQFVGLALSPMHSLVGSLGHGQ